MLASSHTKTIPTATFFLLSLFGSLVTTSADTIIDTSSSDGWSYLNITDGVDPAIADTDFNSTWYNPTLPGYVGGSYDGLAFTTGSAAPFHYGTVSGLTGGTPLSRPDSGNRYTAYFYKIIDVPNGYQNLKLSILADDGAFVYLNGELIATDNINEPDTFTQQASLGNEYNYDTPTIIGSPVLKPGINLIAFSIHQTGTTSSDLGFDVKLEGDPILIAHDADGWSILNPIAPPVAPETSGEGYNPALGHSSQAADPDFNTTWSNQSLGSYSGASYDGPAFSSNNQGPFAYGGVNGITPNTTLEIPLSGSRGSAYFVKEFDGGDTSKNSATFSILADDGAYIYLNGNLVAVLGDLPDGSNNDTWERETGADGSESTYHTITVYGEDLIQTGSNLLAVSLHNTKLSSSDLGMSIELTAQDLKSPAIVRGPYLQSASHDRMTVVWRTDTVGDTVVNYGEDQNNLDNSFTLSELTTEHVAPLTGLKAGTRYYYQILSTNIAGSTSAGADAEHYFETYPAAGEKTQSRVWVIGDSGTTSTAKMNVYDAYRQRTGNAHTDAWLMLGDNAYNNGADSEFQSAVFDSYPELLRNTVLWSCRGNHESDYGHASVYSDIHHFPTAGECGGVPSGSELYYSFDQGNIHFICLNTTGSADINDVPGSGGMIDWLELDLQTTDRDWIIAYFHHGPYTKGSHDSDTEHRHIKSRRYITPLLEKYGVDLVLSGHSHCYERSMLINGHHSNMSTVDTSDSSTFVLATHGVDQGNGSTLGSIDANGDFLSPTGADGAYEKPLATGETGTIYAIAGASGKLSSWDDGSNATVNPTPHPVFIVNLRVMGSMIITVDGNSMNAQYLDDGNVIRDDFTILKGSTVEVSATDDTLEESGPDDTATFTVTRSGATSLPETVTYQVSGSATNGVDYAPLLTGSVDFLAGETQKTITITRNTDDLAESTENCTLTILAATKTVGDTGTLKNKYFLGANTDDSILLKDSPSQQWWFDNFGAESVSELQWAADDDKDGLSLLLEYALGGSASTNDWDLMPTFQKNSDTIELLFNKNNALSDITYQVVKSTDISTWDSNGVSESRVGDENPTGVESWKGSAPIDQNNDKKFLRLEIIQN